MDLAQSVLFNAKLVQREQITALAAILALFLCLVKANVFPNQLALQIVDQDTSMIKLKKYV